MGLFSKKDYVCLKCGKAFQARFKPVDNLCIDCCLEEEEERKKLSEPLKGYISYYENLTCDIYSVDDLRNINKQRNELEEKYNNNFRIDEMELMDLEENYKNITEEQTQNAVARILRSKLSGTKGVVHTDNFLVSTEYDSVLVDTDDIFAVGYIEDPYLNSRNRGVCLCVIFTNNPFVPVLPMVVETKNLSFSVSYVSATFSRICKNLTYDVMHLEKLKKQIKEDGQVKGALGVDFVMEQIENAKIGFGIFNSTKMHSELMPMSIKIMRDMGYIEEGAITAFLRFDKLENRQYWLAQIEKYKSNFM